MWFFHLGFRQDVRAMTGRVFGDEVELNLPGAFRRNQEIIRDGSWSCLTTVGRLDRSKHFWCAPSVWFLDVYDLYMNKCIYIYMNNTEWVILSQYLHCAYVGCCAKLAGHEKNISKPQQLQRLSRQRGSWPRKGLKLKNWRFKQLRLD